MPLWLAAVLFAAAIIGIVLCRKYLRRKRTAQILCTVGCALVALVCAVYIALTLLFVHTVQNRPPV